MSCSGSDILHFCLSTIPQACSVSPSKNIAAEELKADCGQAHPSHKLNLGDYSTFSTLLQLHFATASPTFTGACRALVNAGSIRVSLPNVLIYPALCGAGAGAMASSFAPVWQYPEKTGDIQQSAFQQNLSPSCWPTNGSVLLGPRKTMVESSNMFAPRNTKPTNAKPATRNP